MGEEERSLADAGSLNLGMTGLLLVGLLGASAVLFPTLVGVVSSRVKNEGRGRAISLVTTVTYLGFLLGPVYVGLWGAMLCVAALGAALFVLAPFVLRRITRHD